MGHEEHATMENERFDDLARTLAGAVTSRTRRSTVGLALGGLLGGLAAAGGDADARGRKAHVTAEQKKGKGKGKKKKKDKKDEKKCNNGQQRCGDDCVNLKSDRNNCGSCGRVCSEKEECINGGCFGCSDPLTRCGGDECFDLTSDNQHCGSCDKACGRNEQCINSFCTCAGPRCPIGNGETKCCPAVGGVCCSGGGCCPNGQSCTSAGTCCADGSYLCPDGVFCCPNGRVCRGGRCTIS